MGLFAELTAADAEAIADTFELGRVVRMTPIAAGTINSGFDVYCGRGAFFVRVNSGKTPDDLAYECELLDALLVKGVRVPRQMRTWNGGAYAEIGAKLVSVFAWCHGAHVLAVEAAHAEQLGAELAQLHLAGLDLRRRASIYDHAHLLGRHARIAAAAATDPLLAHAAAVLGDELLAAGAAADLRARATTGVIHGDLFRDNVLFDAEGRLTALLDFEQASGGSLAYDLAVCLNDWCWDEAAPRPRPDLARALLAGYQAVRPLPDADRAALPIEIRAAAARFTLTRITDVYLARVANPEKDFRAFLARVEAWRGPALASFTAAL